MDLTLGQSPLGICIALSNIVMYKGIWNMEYGIWNMEYGAKKPLKAFCGSYYDQSRISLEEAILREAILREAILREAILREKSDLLEQCRVKPAKPYIYIYTYRASHRTEFV